MNEVGKEYGAALYMLACEDGKEAEYKEELVTLSRLFEEEKEYGSFLLSPNVPTQERVEALGQVCAPLVSSRVTSFVQLLLEKGRFSHFEEAKEEYFLLHEQATRMIKVKIRSAVELSPAEKQRLQTKLETVYKAYVSVTYEIAPELIGGIVMETDDKVTDGSIRHRLQHLKEVMSR